MDKWTVTGSIAAGCMAIMFVDKIIKTFRDLIKDSKSFKSLIKSK